MTHRHWTCPTCGAEYYLELAGQPVGTRQPEPEPDDGELCTDHQGKALYALGQELPDGQGELKRIIRDDYGKGKIDDLTKKEASQLITRLQRESRRRG